ncbi:metallopeptidase family protein [Patescibacteria group bacterium]|nr:metallopeptidase family protein [Patescibacteria group bacterium]MBU2220037.1 metallopeptidase family protein [Patescibacteria group bacterium]MBU2264873.1 metallopeptidase family protein [Patescibacteria group bacterium]
MERDAFEKLVAEAMDEIPPEFLAQLKNVAVVVEDEPSEEQLKKLKLRRDLTLLGLYEGVPLTRRGEYTMTLPDKITIFKNSIELVAQTAEEIKKIVKDTVRHEIAHHFGSDERGASKAAKK